MRLFLALLSSTLLLTSSLALALHIPTAVQATTPSSAPTNRPQMKAAGPVYNPVPDERAADRSSSASASSAESAQSARASLAIAEFQAQTAAGLSAGAPDDTLVDPCGPPSQAEGVPGSASTCHQNVSVAETATSSYYGVECRNENNGYVLDHATCSDAIGTICYQISGIWGPKYQVYDQWIWSTEEGNCTFGYWLPSGGAPPPSYKRCRDQIMGPMNDECQGPRWNAGSVNLKKLPSANAEAVTGTGVPVEKGWPSYIMVAQKSYWGVNSMDAQ